MEDLPSDWFFVDNISLKLEMNYHMNLVAKKINNQHFVSQSKTNYFDPEFRDKLMDVKIINKINYLHYLSDEIIHNGMF